MQSFKSFSLLQPPIFSPPAPPSAAQTQGDTGEGGGERQERPLGTDQAPLTLTVYLNLLWKVLELPD